MDDGVERVDLVRLNPEEEGFCAFEHPISPALCKMFKVEPTIKTVVGVESSFPRNAATKAYKLNPKLNVHFAVNAVIRILRVNHDETVEFGTGWIASPPITEVNGDRRLFLFFVVTAAHVVSKKNAEDSAPREFRGRFGQPKGFHDFYSSHGFRIERCWLYHDSDADLAVMFFTVTEEQRMHAIPDGVSFLLPASPTKYAGAGFGAFGYPGIDSFREICNKEWLGEAGEEKIWQRYGALFRDKQACYASLLPLTSGLRTGDMCCSPSTPVSSEGTCGYFKSVSLPGCGGSPLLSNVSEAQGYACYTLRGSQGEGKNVVNRATSHDHPGFVAFYGRAILKHISPESLVGRSRAPFEEWCRMHGLEWGAGREDLQDDLHVHHDDATGGGEACSTA